MIYAQPSICPGELDTNFLWGVAIQSDQLISARQPELIIINKKKRTCRIVDFDFLADHCVKV